VKIEGDDVYVALSADDDSAQDHGAEDQGADNHRAGGQSG
jgi:hypothetical protein